MASPPTLLITLYKTTFRQLVVHPGSNRRVWIYAYITFILAKCSTYRTDKCVISVKNL